MSDLENMDTLRFRERVHQRRRHSQPLTDEEITYITQQSAELADESLTGKAFECLVLVRSSGLRAPETR
jgi:phage-related minor tail protein